MSCLVQNIHWSSAPPFPSNLLFRLRENTCLRLGFGATSNHHSIGSIAPLLNKVKFVALVVLDIFEV